MKGILNCTIERTPFAGSKRKAPGSRGDLEEDEMSKTLSEALQATVCMVSIVGKSLHFSFNAKKRRKFQNLCKESEEIAKEKK